MKVLGIESSCDESSAAIVVDGREVLSNIVASQIPVHAKYGGVVPELASRAHVLDLVSVVRGALSEADAELEELDAIAVTQGPGLVGSLLVGIEMAKALAYKANKPLVGVNHIEAHLTAAMIRAEDGWGEPELPYLGLVVSGGHTSLYLVRAIGDYQAIGHTRDDAAGEALDKAGKMLGLGYPGGVHIDRLSEHGAPDAIAFPRAMRRRGNYEFSFSGLKTAVMTYLNKLGHLPSESEVWDICASVQEAVVDALVYKTRGAALALGVPCVVLAGGVSANRRLRERMRDTLQPSGIRVTVPPRALCTDNAAMVAGLGFHNVSSSSFEQHALNARSSWRVIGTP